MTDPSPHHPDGWWVSPGKSSADNQEMIPQIEFKNNGTSAWGTDLAQDGAIRVHGAHKQPLTVNVEVLGGDVMPYGHIVKGRIHGLWRLKRK